MRLKSILVTILYLFIFLSAIPSLAQSPTRGSAPDWAVLQPVPEKVEIDANSLIGGFHYLLIDIQRNLPREETFRHFCIRVTTSDAVQSSSDIDVNYDPTYQTLQFNMVRLHRDGRVIDNLHNHEIKTFQRESGMDRNLYDGSMTAVINQENVRIGDIIEYAYTVKGYNPIHKGDYFTSFKQQATIPIQEYHFKLITQDDRPLHMQYRHEGVEPKVRNYDSLVEYSWELLNIPAFAYPDNTPYWYSPLPEAQISSYDQWSQVVNWALPHYQINAEDSAALLDLAPELTPAVDRDGKIIQAIRFVQDEVRYLGMEGGLGAYRPNQPYLVYQRRFGDCKDKSLLLTALLKNMGIDAHPVLVNTDLLEHVSEEIPSPHAFNHCIVKFTHNGRDIFVDPTISNQGGDLDHLDVLLYGKCLVIGEGITGLSDLPEPQPNTVVVDYLFALEEIGGSATLNITTTYLGMRSDTQRDNFLTNSAETISLSSLDYYSNAYPGISELKPLEFTDEDRDGDNRFTVVEHYLIDGGWVVSENDSSMLNFEITPMEMLGVADIPASAERTAPYATGPLLDLKVNMTVMMPEDWPVSDAKVNIQNDAFIYDSELSGDGDKIESNFHYQRLKQYIPAEKTREHIADHDRIWNDLFLNLTHDSDLEGFSFSWFAGILALAILILGLIAARNIHRNYDPEPSTRNAAIPMGGWLYLAAFGALGRPINTLLGLVSDSSYFDHNTWVSMLQDSNYSSFSGLGFMMGFEILYMTLLLAFSLLVLVQFFQKRSSLPRLLILALVSGLSLTVLDFILCYFLLDDGHLILNTVFEYNEISGVLISTLIWVPYFLKSDRVKQTFVNRAHGNTTPVHENPVFEPRPSSKMPPVMVMTAIVQILSTVALILLMLESSPLELPSETLPGSLEALQYRSGMFSMIFVLVAFPLVGLFSIVTHRTWARIYNLILLALSFLAFLLVVIIYNFQDPEPQPTELFLGFFLLSSPGLITALLLFFNKAAKIFPLKYHPEYSEETGQWSYPETCREQASELFRKIQENFQGLSMVIQDEDPNQPVRLSIPEQPGVPRAILVDLQKIDVLNLSIGPVWWVWKSSNYESVRTEFHATVCGVLDGTYKYIEYLNKDELRVVRIQRPKNKRWEEVRSWSKGRWNASSKLREVVVDFGSAIDSPPDQD